MVIAMHIGIAERTSFRGEYLSDRNPHNGFENAFIRELILQANAAVDTDNPDSLRYGTNWKPIVPEVNMTKNSADITNHNVEDLIASLVVQFISC